MTKLSQALVKAQKEMGAALKDSKNPYFKSSYANYNSVRDAVLPPLNNNGIVALQPIVYIDGRSFVKTVLLHESGEAMESLTEIVCAKANDPQAWGAASSYAKRYALQSFICVGAEDDDAESAMNRAPAQIQTSTPTIAAKPSFKNLKKPMATEDAI